MVSEKKKKKESRLTLSTYLPGKVKTYAVSSRKLKSISSLTLKICACVWFETDVLCHDEPRVDDPLALDSCSVITGLISPLEPGILAEIQA